MNDKKEEVAQLLLTSWKETVRNNLIPEYIARLTEEIIKRKNKWVLIILLEFLNSNMNKQ